MLRSTQATTKSGPMLPLMRPIAGVARMLSSCDSDPGALMLSRRPAIAFTRDQVLWVGPPGEAQDRMTARTPGMDAEQKAVTSMAASWASAPLRSAGGAGDGSERADGRT